MNFVVFLLCVSLYSVQANQDVLSEANFDSPSRNRHEIKPQGWVWCTDSKIAETFAFKPCPGDPNLEECLKDTKANRKQVLALKAGNWWSVSELTKKWALCYLVRVGVMSENGVLKQDIVLKYIPDKNKLEVERAINKCLYKQAHDPVETAWHYLTCFRSQLPSYAETANRIG